MSGRGRFAVALLTSDSLGGSPDEGLFISSGAAEGIKGISVDFTGGWAGASFSVTDFAEAVAELVFVCFGLAGF